LRTKVTLLLDDDDDDDDDDLQIEYVEPHDKIHYLVSFLNRCDDSGLILVFVERKRDADYLEVSSSSSS
jgi:superfamily II DNA/RNA helicase